MSQITMHKPIYANLCPDHNLGETNKDHCSKQQKYSWHKRTKPLSLKSRSQGRRFMAFSRAHVLVLQSTWPRSKQTSTTGPRRAGLCEGLAITQTEPAA